MSRLWHTHGNVKVEQYSAEAESAIKLASSLLCWPISTVPPKKHDIGWNKLWENWNTHCHSLIKSFLPFPIFFNPTFLSKSLFKVLFWVKLFLFWAAHFFGFLFWATQFVEPFFEQITAFEHFFESFFEHFLFRALFWVLFRAPKKELFSLSTFLSTFLRAFFLLFSVRFLPL